MSTVARMPVRTVLVALIAAFVAIGFGAPASAQVASASIAGTVTDATGALPTATVVAVNTQTGFRHEAQADNEGRYQIAGLQPGTYDITVSAEAFQPKTQRLQVLVGQTSTVDFRLSLDAVYAENITVVGDATPIVLDARTPEIATNITTQQIESLPLNNRNFLAFAGLAPGVSFTRNNDGEGQSFSSGAQDAKQVNVFIDGVSFKNDIIKGGAFMQDSSRGNPFPQSAVQEYQVITQNYKAEYEKATAAVISAVTKSGGNEFRGDVFWFFQDEGLVSQDDFARNRGDEKAPFDRNQYGLSLGGPILRDKLNFFLSAERNERDVVSSVFTGADWANAPSNVRSILDQYQTGSVSAPFESTLWFGKLSFQPSSNQSAELSLHFRDEDELRGFGGQRVQQGATNIAIGTDAATLRHQFVFGSNAINEAVVTYQALAWADTAVDMSVPHMNYQNLLDIGSKDYIQDLEQKRIGIRDDVSFFANWNGTHTIKVGGVASTVDYDMTKSAYLVPYYEFRPAQNWQYPALARIGFGDPNLDFSNEQFGIYAQDDWAIGRLTVSGGLRWDYETNMLNNDWVTPADIAQGLRTACRTYDNPVGGRNEWCIRDLFDVEDYISTGDNRESYKGMIQPRFGLSYDVADNGNTVVFGGWGLYYDRVTLNDIYDEAYRQQWRQYTICFTQDGTQPADCGPKAIQWRPEYMTAEGLRGLIASGQVAGAEVFLLENDTKPPRSTQWTLGLRQKLGRSWLGSLTYANSRSKNGLAWSFGTLPPGTNFNDRWGNWVRIPGYEFIMRSYDEREREYDGVYLTLDRPRTAGSRWGANIAYTWSKGLQNASLDDGVAFAFDFLPGEWPMFPSNGDERHRLVMSGSVALPFNFEGSSIISLGSGTPWSYTDCLAGWDKCVFNPNGGEQEGESFLGLGEWGYRTVDMRLQWNAPQVAGARVSLIGEAFNVFNFDNNGCFDGWAGAPNEPSPTFGNPTCQFNTRRFQLGARVAF